MIGEIFAEPDHSHSEYICINSNQRKTAKRKPEVHIRYIQRSWENYPSRCRDLDEIRKPLSHILRSRIILILNMFVSTVVNVNLQRDSLRFISDASNIREKTILRDAKTLKASQPHFGISAFLQKDVFQFS